MKAHTNLTACKAFLAGQVLITFLFCGLIAWCPVTHAANHTFNGYVYSVESDLGGAKYSGIAVNMLFHGGLNDATLEGFITDGFRETAMHCCGPFVDTGLAIENDEVLDEGNAALLNAITGGSYSAGDLVDLAIMSAVAQFNAGGGFQARALILQVIFIFDPTDYPDASLAHFPVDPTKAIARIFTLEEKNAVSQTIFKLTGVVTELWTDPADFNISRHLNDPWVSFEAPYQGFFISVLPGPGYLFLGWFTFDFIPPPENNAFFGAADQRWVTGGGFYFEDSVTVDFELTTGGVFNGSTLTETQMQGYGTARIGFIDCQWAVMNYEFPDLGLGGQMMLERVPVGSTEFCQANSQP